mgnify:CR=1 FL=1
MQASKGNELGITAPQVCTNLKAPAIPRTSAAQGWTSPAHADTATIPAIMPLAVSQRLSELCWVSDTRNKRQMKQKAARKPEQRVKGKSQPQRHAIEPVSAHKLPHSKHKQAAGRHLRCNRARSRCVPPQRSKSKRVHLDAMEKHDGTATSSSGKRCLHQQQAQPQ